MANAQRFFTLAVVSSLAFMSPLTAQSQNTGNALNLFQNLLRGAAPDGPQPSSPAGLANSLLGGTQAARPGAGDLVQLLSQSVEQIDEPREIQIGKQLAALLLGSKPLYPDIAMQRYVNQLGRWISLHSSRPDLPWAFAVLDDPGFNAFAAPGGYVFVTKGLIDRIADESELAGILAHEITHVTSKHHLTAMNKVARSGLLTQVIGSQFKNNLGGLVSSQLLNLGRNIYSKGLDQDDELEADRTAVALAARAGFDPYGLVAVLQQLRTAAPDDALFALSLSTHPPAQLRLNQLELAMGTQLDTYTGQKSVTLAQRMERLAQVNRRQATSAK
jgi:predicted Zn-dependent protease